MREKKTEAKTIQDLFDRVPGEGKKRGSNTEAATIEQLADDFRQLNKSSVHGIDDLDSNAEIRKRYNQSEAVLDPRYSSKPTRGRS